MPHAAGLLSQPDRCDRGAGNPRGRSHSEKKRVVSARDAGVTEFLAKPISAKSLYERILNVVANPRPFIRSKTYFGPDRRRNINQNYVGVERRKGGKAEVTRQQPLLDKAKVTI